jgi:lipopolysaccharide/colanic/teichoic acid biosynthesis glycosyltransferase
MFQQIHGVDLTVRLSSDERRSPKPEPYLFVDRRRLRERSLLQRALKRTFDIGFVLTFLALFWWLFVVVAIGIKLSGPGSLVFGHTRIGRHGKRFECLKFRSMVCNASEVLSELLERDPACRVEWETNFKLKNDPRITTFGNFIRRTSLDELPQLWNIVKGEMSVVGPRPVIRQELTLYYGATRRHYLSVRPGLTGPWQVNGRNDTSYEERVQLDRDYVLNWSLFGDLKIVFQTVAVVFARKGAY